MALTNDKSVRQRLLTFIEKRENQHGKVDTFKDAKPDLRDKFSDWFCDEESVKKLKNNYNSAKSLYRQITLEKNLVVKTKRDVIHPKMQQQIKEMMAESPEKFVSGGKNKTIVLKSENNDKVFFKMSGEVRDNLVEFIKYWDLQHMGQYRQAMAKKSFFTTEMIEEFYRIFSETRDSKKCNNDKLTTYKKIEKGML